MILTIFIINGMLFVLGFIVGNSFYTEKKEFIMEPKHYVMLGVILLLYFSFSIGEIWFLMSYTPKW